VAQVLTGSSSMHVTATPCHYNSAMPQNFGSATNIANKEEQQRRREKKGSVG